MYKDYLLLGGAGLVGTQVVRHIVRTLQPRRIVVCSLNKEEAKSACKAHREEFGEDVSFEPAWGNLFVPTSMSDLPRGEILASKTHRRTLLDAVYGDYQSGFKENHLVSLIRRFRPEVIVDSVNTATSFSYQDVFDGVAKVRGWIGKDGFSAKGTADLETFLLSQSTPQLIRHVRFVHTSTRKYGVSVYLKVGTTGTGGMGLNIPYTHSEDRPSKKLLAKTEAAFAQTGLLFLLARTPKAPIVKEVKPAAMIGYRAVQVKEVTDRHGNSKLFEPHRLDLKKRAELALREDPKTYTESGTLRVPVVDTGENGVFTRGEFAAITALGQMEYITPEEIARTVVLEIRGANTGKDIISALDGSVLSPSYKAGLVREVALQDLDAVETDATASGEGHASVALGRLGPPELSKLLFEAALIKRLYPEVGGLIADKASHKKVSERLAEILKTSELDRLACSIGIPVLMPNGETLLRGPAINVPEVLGHGTTATLNPKSIDQWAKKGWVDLRPANVKVWRARFEQMLNARADLRRSGSAAANRRSYMSARFEIGEVVAWIFNNEMEGYRIK
jgi:hypothetical protein